jgi:uncharacterized protein (TIGR02145 family)
MKIRVGISLLILFIFINNACRKEEPALSVLTTKSATEITKTSASSGGNITTDNGGTISARGVCWSTSANPTTDDNKTNDGSGSGSFTSSINGLLPATTYYVRAYAVNSAGTAYGNEINFITDPELATVVTAELSSVSSTSAIGGGTVTKDGGASVTERGICWSKTQNPTTGDSITSDGAGKGDFTSIISGLKASTTYYVRAYALNSVGIAYGDEKSFTTLPPSPPVLSTTGLSSLTTNSVKSGAIIINDGGADIIAGGICWNTEPGPTIDINKTTDEIDGGKFFSSLTGLIPNTTYYLRSYATNSTGTGYGDELVFKTYTVIDADSNGYYSVNIGDQVWLKENLSTTKYNNGDPIGTTNPATLDVSEEDAPKYQWAPGGIESNVSTYGRLYSWYAITDSRGVCPTGWHVPTDAEFTALTDYLINNGYGLGGSGTGIAKSMASETGWLTVPGEGVISNDESNNSSGFTGMPAGYRFGGNSFTNTGYVCTWWTSSEYEPETAWYRELYFSVSEINIGITNKEASSFSVRCIKDQK